MIKKITIKIKISKYIYKTINKFVNFKERDIIMKYTKNEIMIKGNKRQ